ncbi:hypothetical protein L6164_035861 [Bauhinia variegata]|uniref:Uncharacterized protein n=1 Tax=Bauhinia variegata TaxID=167791 RepID=A0ACB9KFB8_BAUVA|nr:hypothetical protein L6164_035861 [Bauhinia variegata]
MACCIRCSRGMKICCGVTAIILIALVVTLTILFFTVFKPKDPIIINHPVKLENLDLVFFPVIELKVSLGIVVTVRNRNHGSFSYHNSTAYVYYRGNNMAEAPINADTIPARGDHNISTSLNVFVDNLTKFQNLPEDIKSGVVNLTSASTLYGKIKILNFFKVKATSYSSCDIFVFIFNNTSNSICKSKVKL